MISPFDVFLEPEAQRINRARLEHLASLGLDLAGKRVLEVGAGIGLHTHFFEQRGCDVTSTDGAPANAAEIMRRWPYRRVGVLDLEQPADLSGLGTFDIVFCYGTLYHLRDPDAALGRLAMVCTGIVLVETIVSRGSFPEINPVIEPPIANQAVSGIGCRPTRSWVMSALRRYFGHAYTTLDQPDYPDFVTDWNLIARQGNLRAVFVGARNPLTLPTLVARLPVRHRNAPPRLRPVGGRRVWIDVGAHRGEHSMAAARQQPDLTVHAFEPLPALFDLLSQGPENFRVHAVAVGEQNGVAPFHVDRFEAASSLLVMDETVRTGWKGGHLLGQQREILVPVTRLDSFMQHEGIGRVEFLKIDAQGADLAVLRSAGERLRDIDRIQLEVAVTPRQLYLGAEDKPAILAFMAAHGFRLAGTETQSEGQEENLTFVQIRERDEPGTPASSGTGEAESWMTGLYDLSTAKTAYGEVAFADGTLELVTDERQWAYTAVTPIGAAFRDAGDDRFRIQMAVQVDAGTLQAGVLNREETDFPGACLVRESPDWQQITLVTPSIERAGPLVIRNASELGASRGRCRLVSVTRLAKTAAQPEEAVPDESEAELLAVQLRELCTALASLMIDKEAAGVAAIVTDGLLHLRSVLARGGHALIDVRRHALLPVFAAMPTGVLSGIAASIAVPPRLAPASWQMDDFLENTDLATVLRYAIWLAMMGRADTGPIEVPWHNGTRLSLNFCNDLGRAIFVGAQYEPNEFALLDRILCPGMTFLDGGANEGAYAVFAAARVGPTGRVVAIEPSPRELSRLHANVALNNFGNVNVVEAALADREGVAELLLADGQHAGQNTLGDFMYQGVAAAGRVQVAATTIDHLMDRGDLTALDVVKLDLEGAELRALQGARRALDRWRPVIMLEAAEVALAFQSGSHAAILALLTEHQYRAWAMDPATGGLTALDKAGPGDSLIAVHPGCTRGLDV